MLRDARRFDLVAETQIILDGEVAHCWELVRAGIQRRLLDTGNLRALIDQLRAGNAVALDDLALEREAGGDRLRMTLGYDQRTCPAAAMLDELERLARRAGASSAVPRTATPPAAAPIVVVPPADAPPPADEATGGGEPPDLLGLLARLLGTTPEQLARDPAAHRAQVERVRAAAARWRAVAADPGSDAAARDIAQAALSAALAATGEQAAAAVSDEHSAAAAAPGAPDLEAAVRALGRTPDEIAGTAGAITDWLEQRTPAAGAAVDRMIATLEAATAPFLGRPTPTEVDAERDHRLREEARAAIVARIKLPPP